MPSVWAQSNITVRNKFQDPSNPTQYGEYENFTHVEGQAIYPTGTTLNMGGFNSFHTQNSNYSGVFQGYNHKFSRWQDDAAQVSFTTLLNISSIHERRSYLDITRNAYLRTSFEDYAGYANQGEIGFIDPWYVYSTGTHTYAQPFLTNPNTYTTLSLGNGDWDLTGQAKGIFTGIHRNTTNNNIPYYSVRVPKFYEANASTMKPHDNPQLNPLHWIFMYWKHSGLTYYNPDISTRHVTGYAERAITFGENNVVSTAWYKAHLYSNLPNDVHPTAVNSQRKIDVDANGVYHMTYESSSEIWYCKSTDDGQHWSAEEMVSDPMGISHRPSIAEYGGTVYIVYVGGEHEITLKSKQGSGSWTETSSWDISDPSAPNPVVEVNNFCPGTSPAVVCLVWEDRNTTTNINYLKYHFEEMNGGYSALGSIVASSSRRPQYPSIATTPSSNTFCIAWKDSSFINYSSITVWHCNQQFYTTAPIEQVSFYFETAIGASSITMDFMGRPSVAYESARFLVYPDPNNYLSFNPKLTLGGPSRTPSTVMVRQKSFAPMTSNWKWNTTASAAINPGNDYGFRRPTIGAQPLNGVCQGAKKAAGLRVTYNGPEDDRKIRVMQIVDPIPCEVEIHRQFCGKDPNVIGRSEIFGKLFEVYCHNCEIDSGGSNPPSFSLNHDLQFTGYHLEKTKTMTGNLNVREAFIGKDTSVAAFTMREPRVISTMDSTVLEWNYVHDTLVVGVNATLEEKMKTENFTVPSGGAFVFDNEVIARNPLLFPSGASFLIRFRHAETDEMLLTEQFPISSFPTDSSLLRRYEISLSSIEGNSVYASLSVSNVIDTFVVSINDVYLEDSPMEKKDDGKKSIRTHPHSVTLEQNHPNPLTANDPSTEISYSIPESDHVRIVVTDMLGRIVATIIDGEKPAGLHTVRFDASTLPSGVYYYRLLANGQTLTKKMTILK